jgi:hypothetical protein
MPVNKKLEQGQLEADSAVKPELKKSGKAQGTRFGTLADWREGSFRTGETVGRYGRSVRDGQ